MDFQTMLNNAMQASRNEELKTSPQLLLGEIILKLEAVVDKNKPLYIDIMDKRPMSVNSWRGSYYELAITTKDFGSYNGEKVTYKSEYGDSYEQINIGKEKPTVSEWINVLNEAVGKTFVGYKGGDFLMSKNTPVWLAEYGDASFKTDEEPLDEEKYSNYREVYFVDVKEEKDKVYLITKIQEE